MIVKATILSVSKIVSGVSSRGNEWKRCDFVFAFGENRLVGQAWNDDVERVSRYDLNAKREVLIDLGFGIRDSYGFDGRKFNEIIVRSVKYPEELTTEQLEKVHEECLKVTSKNSTFHEEAIRT